MPLILLCGQPSSGKSAVAAQLAELLRAKGLEVVVVDEDSLHLDRNESYKDAASEKNTRGLLKATADRSLSKRRVVLFDSLNNIKGYRYELWCQARTAATRYCVVHVDTPVDTCRQWNSQRRGAKYAEHVFEDLSGRFERPDPRNRWDSPLFTLHPLLGPAHIQQRLEEVAAAAAGEGSASGEQGRTSAAGVQQPGAVARPLEPNLATMSGGLAATNVLYEVDKAAQAVVDRIAEAQAAAGAGPVGAMPFEDEGLPALQLPRQVTLPELRRHKRSFMRLATNLTWSRVHDAATARRMFLDYLRQQLAQQA